MPQPKKPSNPYQSTVQTWRLLLTALCLSRIASGAKPDDFLGNCIGLDYPDAVERETHADLQLQMLNANNLLQNQNSFATYSEEMAFKYFNEPFIWNRMGGKLSLCHQVLDLVMEAGNLEPLYARIFDVVLGAIPNIDIVISSVQPDHIDFGRHEPHKDRINLYVKQHYSARVLQAKIRETVLHEMVHALFHARSGNFGSNFLTKGSYFSTRKDEFNTYYTDYVNGQKQVALMRDVLIAYRQNTRPISSTEKEQIENLIEIAKQAVVRYGEPILYLKLQSNDEYLIRQKDGRCIGIKNNVNFGEAIVEMPVSFIEEYSIANGVSELYIAYKDPLMTYLSILNSQMHVIFNDDYLKQLQQQDPEEFFSYCFGGVPLVFMKTFFKPLLDVIESSVQVLENTPVKNPLTPQWSHPYHFHPIYDQVDSLYLIYTGSHVIKSQEIGSILYCCRLILDTKDSKKYFLAEAALQEIIAKGFLSGTNKANVQLMLGRALYRQDKKIQAQEVYHRAAKTEIRFSAEDINNYEDAIAVAKVEGVIKSGDSNLLNRKKRIEL